MRLDIALVQGDLVLVGLDAIDAPCRLVLSRSPRRQPGFLLGQVLLRLLQILLLGRQFLLENRAPVAVARLLCVCSSTVGKSPGVGVVARRPVCGGGYGEPAGAWTIGDSSLAAVFWLV